MEGDALGGVAMKEFAHVVLAGGPLLFALVAASVAAPEGSDEGATLEKATFAGGCFWCMEHPFDELPGVVSVTSGYTGGHTKNPTYEEVSSGRTGHAEAVQVVYDPGKIPYPKLLAVYWRNIDPANPNGQFCDIGTQYRAAIFCHGEGQRKAAEESLMELEKGKPFREKIVTLIVPATEFWPAEEYHQHYSRKNPLRYRFYRAGCGRDARLKQLWGAK
jgi:peptide-methionine (S)-S-oxide reductase